jgi:hypothetical protein
VRRKLASRFEIFSPEGTSDPCQDNRLSVRMIVPPGPIFFLLLALRLGKLVILPVMLFEKPVPSAIFMLIPVVIVLMLSIVNATIPASQEPPDSQPRPPQAPPASQSNRGDCRKAAAARVLESRRYARRGSKKSGVGPRMRRRGGAAAQVFSKIKIESAVLPPRFDQWEAQRKFR